MRSTMARKRILGRVEISCISASRMACLRRQAIQPSCRCSRDVVRDSGPPSRVSRGLSGARGRIIEHELERHHCRVLATGCGSRPSPALRFLQGTFTGDVIVTHTIKRPLESASNGKASTAGISTRTALKAGKPQIFNIYWSKPAPFSIASGNTKACSILTGSAPMPTGCGCGSQGTRALSLNLLLRCTVQLGQPVRHLDVHQNFVV